MPSQQQHIDAALEIIGGLSKPSKMPWYSYSTPASACITGSALRAAGKKTVCGSCYAFKGNYGFPNVRKALQKRLDAMTAPNAAETWLPAFVLVLNYKAAINKGKRPLLFRWFDSGDLPSVKTLEMICEIARQTPQIRHCLPTREYRMVKEFIAAGGSFPENLVVRMSVALIGAKPNAQPMGLPFASVGRDDDKTLFQCPAMKNDGKCGACSHCWTNDNTNYGKH